MPVPMTAKNHGKIIRLCRNAAKCVAAKSMTEAAEDLVVKQKNTKDSFTDVGVSVYGTWQRCGYSSLNVAVAAISIDSRKIVDCEAMTRFSNACAIYDKYKMSDPMKYESWKTSHRCKINYRGSAPNMESEGAKRIFQRSIETQKLRYTKYFGDGDSKSHSTVKDIYPGVTVRKFECVGHVQKRVGKRLQNLRKKVKNLGGKDKLTLHTIDKLQNL